MAFRKPIAAAALLPLVLGAAGSVLAQQMPPAQPPQQGGRPTAAPAAKSKAAAPAAKSDATAPASGGEAGLRQRVEQLEEQLVDLQVVIGTLESLAKSGGGSVPAARAPMSGGGLGPSDAARLDGIETQIRALTAQVEQLAQQMRGGNGVGRRSDTGGPPPATARFGSTTVTSDGDPIGSLISGGAAAPSREMPPLPPAREPVGAGTGGVSSAPLPPPTATAALAPESDGNPKSLYETAYGYLLQQDYGAAEAAFEDFLKRYPGDSLAGNAQYWLGEAFFVRGNYKQAAGAFLKGYQTYGKSSKAPDSLLKLAMSLDRLGQKDAACSSFGELSARFPTAPAHVKSKAQSERQRLGCS